MTTRKDSGTGPVQALRDLAKRYPEVQEGIACEGTYLEKITVKARNKAFLFLGVADVMLKLRESLPEAMKLAARDPSRYRAGISGWVTIKFGTSLPSQLDLLRKWLDESYRLVAHKDLVTALLARDAAKAKKK
jgi:hypothetical protein